MQKMPAIVTGLGLVAPTDEDIENIKDDEEATGFGIHGAIQVQGSELKILKHKHILYFDYLLNFKIYLFSYKFHDTSLDLNQPKPYTFLIQFLIYIHLICGFAMELYIL